MVRFKVDKYVKKYDSEDDNEEYWFTLIPVEESDRFKKFKLKCSNKRYDEGDLVNLEKKERQGGLDDFDE